jgi:hypothetical protein
METNMNVAHDAELHRRAVALLTAASAFWEVHQRLGGPRAVVYLTDTDGRMVIVTRAEYREQLFQNIAPLADETPLTRTERA